MREGEVIGKVGNYFKRERATTYHLHFDMQVPTKYGWVFVNPYMTLVAAYERLIRGPRPRRSSRDDPAGHERRRGPARRAMPHALRDRSPMPVPCRRAAPQPAAAAGPAADPGRKADRNGCKIAAICSGANSTGMRAR